MMVTVLPAAPNTTIERPATETLNLGAAAWKIAAVSLLSGVASLLELAGSTVVVFASLLEFIGVVAELLEAIEEELAGIVAKLLEETEVAELLEETVGALPPVTVKVPLLVAVVDPPVVVTVHL